MYSLGPIEFIVYERETNQYFLIRSCAKCLPSGGFHLEIPFVRIGRTQPLESLKYQDAIKSHRVIENGHEQTQFTNTEHRQLKKEQHVSQTKPDANSDDPGR